MARKRTEEKPTLNKLAGCLFLLLLCGMLVIACDGPMQPVSLTAEDFRFVPDVVRVNASRPLSISVYNGGREAHEFDSRMLVYGVNVVPHGSGMRLQPGDTLGIVVAPPPGTYLYICRRKGHANMTGTLIVE
jgi:plastocyanin